MLPKFDARAYAVRTGCLQAFAGPTTIAAGAAHRQFDRHGSADEGPAHPIEHGGNRREVDEHAGGEYVREASAQAIEV